ncbi:caspase family protein [Streptomyces sp. NPDC016309]|uniref:caspase, EACC1-associated type n=1 Tax=Streptomyces sp. NPDC016309 TaxID=3364965 RepID=UPI00370017E7
MDDDSRHALIIANDDYQEGGLQKLTSPAADAEALAEVLGDPRIGGFDVQVVRNEPSHIIRMRIEDFFAERAPGDTLLLHLSCHGLKSESGQLYFAATDTRPKRLKATGIPADFVETCMADTRARGTVLFLDCCYGGAFSPGSVARAAGDAHVLENFTGERLGGGGRGWAVVTASNSMEYAFEGARLADGGAPKPSVFTGALVSGLATGEADRNEDGKVSLNELYDYVYERVRRENRNQTPSCKSDLQGDLYLAHSERRKIVPAPLPPRLRAALASEDDFSRLGAVTELRSRMDHTDVAIAMAAHEALKEVARNDLQSVAEEAARALGEVRISPEPTVLRLSPVYRHAVPSTGHVRLLGPPLARSCTPRAQDDRLHVTPVADGLAVTVDTSTPGPLRADIVLKGPVGEAVVHVEAEVREAAPGPAGATTVTGEVPRKPNRPPGTPGGPAGTTGPSGATDPTADADPTRDPGRPGRTGTPDPTSGPDPTRDPDHSGHTDRTDPTRDTDPTRNTGPTDPTRNTGHTDPSRNTGHTGHRRDEERHPQPRPQGLKAFRAPALAVAALGLAIAALAIGIKAAVEAARLAQTGETWVDIRDHLAQESLRDLVICLVMALVSLILVGLARYDLRASPSLYGKQSTAVTSLLDWSAKVLALPLFVLSVLGVIGIMIAANVG